MYALHVRVCRSESARRSKAYVAKIQKQAAETERSLRRKAYLEQQRRDAELADRHRRIRARPAAQRLSAVPNVASQDAAAEDGGAKAIFDRQVRHTRYV
eukprot:SAG11_NODE_4695_length_1803_cov_1.308099_1_plen_99_part_00